MYEDHKDKQVYKVHKDQKVTPVHKAHRVILGCKDPPAKKENPAKKVTQVKWDHRALPDSRGLRVIPVHKECLEPLGQKVTLVRKAKKETLESLDLKVRKAILVQPVQKVTLAFSKWTWTRTETFQPTTARESPLPFPSRTGIWFISCRTARSWIWAT